MARQLGAIEVDLSGQNLGVSGLRVISDSGILSHECTVLNLRHNSLKDGGGSCLAAMLSENLAQLTVLDVSENGLGSTAGAALGSALSHTPQLRRLDLSKNALDDDAVSREG